MDTWQIGGAKVDSKEKIKIRNGAEIATHAGSTILSSAPIPVFIVGTIIFGLIGCGVMFIKYFIKILVNKLKN